jgi:tRNA-binding protein
MGHQPITDHRARPGGKPLEQRPMAETIAYSDFERVDIRVGTITDAQPFPQARKPAYKLVIDFQVCAVVNFPPRQIGPFISEVLTLGMPDDDGSVVLVRPDFKVPNGGKLF